MPAQTAGSRRRWAAALCWLLALASSTAAAAAQPSSAQHDRIAAPLLAWSNQPYLAEGQGATSAYQVFDDLHELIRQILQPSASPSSASALLAPEQPPPEVTLLVLGSQLTASDLRSRALRGPLQPLQALLAKAASSVTLPHVMHEWGMPAAVQQSRLAQLAADVHGAAAVQLVGCEGQQSSEAAQHASLADALAGLSGSSQPGVVVVCTTAATSRGGATRAEAIASELQQLADAHAAVAALQRRQLTVYVVTPDGGSLAPERRQLLGAGADTGACDALCRTQVKWLEGILAAAILAVAAFSGMCCLYTLDTPTRFEKSKEGGRNE